MSKKVIFVAGTSFSGSTMLDMILSNDLKGYSLGEICALFRPYRKHHFRLRKELLSKHDKWSDVLKSVEDNLYEKLFDSFPEVDFFVDSSKHVLWMDAHRARLKKTNIETYVVLIYKSPVELAHSFHKRGMLDKWAKYYIGYYEEFLNIVPNYKLVHYRDIAQKDPRVLASLCRHLDIPYFDDKFHFWEKCHTTFFGNNRTRSHVEDLQAYGQEKAQPYHPAEKKKLIYENSFGEEVTKQVELAFAKSPKLKKLQRLIEYQEPVTKFPEVQKPKAFFRIKDAIKYYRSFIPSSILSIAD